MMRPFVALLAATLPAAAGAEVFASHPGDKLTMCQLQKVTDQSANPNDIVGGTRFALLLPVVKKGEPSFDEHKEQWDMQNYRKFDPAGMLGTAKVNVFIDRPGMTAFVAGMMTGPKPMMLLLDQAHQKGGNYFAFVLPVQPRTLQPSGNAEWAGWCSVSSGDAAVSAFEALK